jgi:hypothetical protein
MLKTLAAKHHTTVTKMARKYQAAVVTPYRRRVCVQVVTERAGRKPLVARFGGIPLKRQKRAVIDDRVIAPINSRRRVLVTRLQKRWCELCDKRAREVEVHQIPKIADLAKIKEPLPTWARIMAKRRRKTLVVCKPCHDTIHDRQPPRS